MSIHDVLVFLGSGAAIPTIVGAIRWVLNLKGMTLQPAALRWIVYALALICGAVSTVLTTTFSFSDPGMLSLFILAVFGAAETIYRVAVGKLLPGSVV